MFDIPLKVDKKNYVTSSDKYKEEIEVVCSYYKNFIIKTVKYKNDMGCQSYIVPLSGDKTPQCQLEMMDGEQKVDPRFPGSDYFEGVRGDYAVFFAADSTVGWGMPFLIVRISDNATIYFDLAAIVENNDVALYGIVPEEKGLRLIYTRNFEEALCSVITDGQECIEKIAKLTGVRGDFERVCTNSYTNTYIAECKNVPDNEKQSCIEKKLNSMTFINLAHSPSTISYNVEAFIPKAAPAIKYEQGWQLQHDNFLTKKGDVINCRPEQ